MTEKQSALHAFGRLYDIVSELRHKCPWDRKQTFETLRTNTIEEVYELTDAILEQDYKEICKESGDVMLHLMFYAIMGAEKGEFTMTEILNRECDKLISRHPHIYGEIKADTSEEVKRNWEKIKLSEGPRSVLDGVPRSLPAMIKAIRTQEKVQGIGFDWEDPVDVLSKIEEEIAELKVELAREDKSKTTDEMGDVLFSMINYCRSIGVNAEDALERTNKKFIKRFKAMEELILVDELNISDMSAAQMDQYWEKAKSLERGESY